MNIYLIELGSSITQIRSILELTQEEFAEKIGISRPTLLKIEKDSNKLTKVIALSMFTALSAEFESHKRNIASVNPKDYQDKESVLKFAKDVLSSMGSLFSKSNLTTLISTTSTLSAVTRNVLVGVVSGPLLVAVGITSLIKKYLKGNEQAEKVVENEVNSNTVMYLLESAQNLVEKKEKECLHYFKLNSWNPLEFVTLLENGEIDK